MDLLLEISVVIGMLVFIIVPLIMVLWIDSRMDKKEKSLKIKNK